MSPAGRASGPAGRFLAGLAGLRRGEPLAPHTTYAIGGRAEAYLEVTSRPQLVEAVAGSARHGIPLLLLGNGSNLLVADAGVAGLVLHPRLGAIRPDRDAPWAAGREQVLLRAEAGARMVQVARAAEQAGLTGLEWALGIPGTVGGSIHNSAGCFGSDVAATVVEVEGVTAMGTPARWEAAECEFRYRTSAFRDGRLRQCVVTGATFALRPAERGAIRARMEEIGKERARTQPVAGRSTGSVFKNPPGDFAGRLIEAAGLKGRRVGGAMVSPEHANFIVNTGDASAADVAALVRLVQAEVAARFGVPLECEIEAVGRWPEGDPLALPEEPKAP
jgi:UDP-N-acetylmuramate dehydrogenase